MVQMGGRRFTITTSLLASLALLAALPAPCFCLPDPSPADHGCCAPSPGFRPATEGCCVGPALPSETEAATPQSPAVAADLTATPRPSSDATLVLDPRGVAAAVSLSPPLTVRRL
jgi:hypothetical protein